MPLLSPRFVALPAAALAIIFALSQAQSGARNTEVSATVQHVTSCAAPANTLASACVLADNSGATLMR